MKIVITESGSEYEIDEDKKLVRRLAETEKSGKSIRVSAAWKAYESIEIGNVLFIKWGDDVPALDESAGIPIGKFTTTSKIISITDTTRLLDKNVDLYVRN